MIKFGKNDILMKVQYVMDQEKDEDLRLKISQVFKNNTNQYENHNSNY